MDKRILLLPLFLITLTACTSTGANYQPIVDGPQGFGYSKDLSQCKHLAEKRGYLNDDVKRHAIAGAVVGGLVGAIAENNSEGIIGGTIAGGVLGAGERAWNTNEERKQIVIRCMSGRGHKVVG